MQARVLILVVVDNGLVHLNHLGYINDDKRVLILVVVDNGLVRSTADKSINFLKCLNPCCSGQWSRTY